MKHDYEKSQTERYDMEHMIALAWMAALTDGTMWHVVHMFISGMRFTASRFDDNELFEELAMLDAVSGQLWAEHQRAARAN